MPLTYKSLIVKLFHDVLYLRRIRAYMPGYVEIRMDTPRIRRDMPRTPYTLDGADIRDYTKFENFVMLYLHAYLTHGNKPNGSVIYSVMPMQIRNI